MHEAHDSEPNNRGDIHTPDGRDDLSGRLEQRLCRNRDVNPGRLGEIRLRIPGQNDAHDHHEVEEVETGTGDELTR